MEQNHFPKQPLKKIALSLSGGGYRATVFHLGSMSYLNRLQLHGKPLLENVEMISTVSGGTITGIVYAVMKHDKKSFAEVYKCITETLKGLDLLKGGFEMLNPGTEWTHGKKAKNLINAFALQYEEAFTKDKVLGDLSSLDSHLKTVVFNSTEFDKGINFRFKNPGTGYSGNYYNRVNDAASKHIRLSDIMAASSCFPGGFEPMLWPDDFIYQGCPDALSALSTPGKVTGIMDGGIYDNQGIESILNYRQADVPYFDLVIISDVTSPFMKPYEPYDENRKVASWEKYTIKSVRKRLKTANTWANCIMLAGLVLCGWQLVRTGFPDSMVAGICLTLAITLIALLVVKRVAINKVRNKKRELENAIRKQIPFFAGKFATRWI